MLDHQSTLRLVTFEKQRKCTHKMICLFNHTVYDFHSLWFRRTLISSSIFSSTIAATKASRKIFPIDHPIREIPPSFDILHSLMIWSMSDVRAKPCSLRNLVRSTVVPEVMMRLSSAVYGVVPGYPRLLIQIMRTFWALATDERRWKVPFYDGQKSLIHKMG